MTTERNATTELPSLNCGEDYIRSFRENGFVKIHSAVPAPFIEKSKTALDRISQKRDQADAWITNNDGREYFINAGSLCHRGEDVFLELLGCPLMLSLAESICGVDFFPIQEFAVIKNRGDNNPVNWHQDVNNGQPGTTFMIGFYLDDAEHNNGALQVIPGSHKSGDSICELQKQQPLSIDMHAGDILIHDLMLAHCSGLLSTNEQRRVVYFEFMSTAHAKREKIYPDEFIHIRTRLIPLAMQKYAELHSEGEKYQWKHPDKHHFSVSENLQEELDDIYKHMAKVKPANYCFDSLHLNQEMM
jgi:hypothetical protein